MDSEKRDRMVARVQDAFDKWPSYPEMPVSTETENIVAVALVPMAEGEEPNTTYVRALHELAAKGEVLGRRGGEEPVIVGRADD